MKRLLRSLVPAPLLGAYHYCLAYLGAFIYRFPSKKLFVIVVTGTKGKSTTVELIRSILAEAGHKTASVSTVQFTIGDTVERNLYKMSTPGRFFLSRFLSRAVSGGATHAVLEITSEAAKQFRHKGIDFDALVFTNLSPEHIESHGSFEKYAAAKLSLAEHLADSPKRPRYIAANMDDAYGKKFLDIAVERKIPFSLKDAEPYQADDSGVRFVWKGELLTAPLPGLFNLKNIVGAVALCEALGVPLANIKKTLEHKMPIAGRAERVHKGQPFIVVIDYAHTADSLRALYETYKAHRIIAVLGSTGGGRDKWKRPEMGRVADEYAASIILTNEDPYDEDPRQIIDDVAAGVAAHKPRVILDRRAAIAEALAQARPGDAVLISGKGTDPYIMGSRGSKEPWSDKRVAEEELDKLLARKS